MKNILPALVLCLLIVTGYHFVIVKPQMKSMPVYSVDFKGLLDAKMAQDYVDQGSAGLKEHEVSEFLQNIEREMFEISEGRPIYVTGAVVFGAHDMTKHLADKYDLNLDDSPEEIVTGRK